MFSKPINWIYNISYFCSGGKLSGTSMQEVHEDIERMKLEYYNVKNKPKC